jgi:hypothetical protein
MDYKNYCYRECLYSIIQYQQEIIKRYEEYIEKNIFAQISKTEKEEFDIRSMRPINVKRITIPQTDFMMLCDPRIAREWDIIKAEHPICSIDAIKYYMEEIERNANSN